MLRREVHVSRLQIGLNEKDVSLLDELAELIRRRNISHFLESFGDWTPKMSQTSDASKLVNSTFPVS